MKGLRFLLIVGVFSLCVSGCTKDDGINVTLQNEINEFVWFAMNDYYFWVDEVEDLSLEKYPTYNALYTFLNGYSSSESLFYDLTVEKDRFSWFVEDYEELEASFQGITKSFGFEYRLIGTDDSNNVFGFIKYVVPTGPADQKGLVRGDIFTAVNGTSLTRDNFHALLSRDQYALTLGEIKDGKVSDTQETVELVSIELTENPIHMAKTLDVDGVKVGYLVYNQFVNNRSYHQEMNQVFGEFQSNGISDLVLDLRYNPGGAVLTSQLLASLIYSKGRTSDVFAAIEYNQEITDILVAGGSDLNYYFIDKLDDVGSFNRLDLNRLFILTSGNTASASELIISGLDPYMDVTLIGTKTVGKNLGSVTIYDSPNYQKTPTSGSTVNHTNPNHKNALQPIISRITNIQNIDYTDGFSPNIEVDEVNYLEDLKPLGDPSEPLLAEALAIITGVARTERVPDTGMKVLFDSESLQKHTNTILLDQLEITRTSAERVF
ncbi:C-terminal processing protease CtpA/Prc, contains a PDZ domain [Ekhidna lutea]|uniref:C-terminal processing protease CtpA/Prc, contains a PDZ domain n=1 Tax=Ekhidna lutea TaxID=447679 RepID=A0A239HH51_EKHLU|nr:S41 family peptidase [Ekhidna lutea]SNS79584.1 C-terminal processing protease CtpA/Prc, contains a PDZ domain [Ekhidna lutea]